jgi:hypothetical protein
MRALSGCTRCGYVARNRAKKNDEASRACPECGYPLKDVDLLAARRLLRASRGARDAQAQRQDSLVEQARAASKHLGPAENAPRSM